ncbi:SgcJ/EcaC family oxidoreductase [Amycolatopsis cihanbeyliensis]|uniref:Uncharacterized protein (TIGR02246 family) n=1 Tax=Amycolatopsis cihanbeyliensis TaxID=1128664 RepID=A0A542DL42_AMYCI|nr:SgcJ/EcaC family oxidoreductase [Amycolatopsis cihanbeyliensis]TQJ03821.1 uncharacterized protein (TIGR02246 family) [Amycolatopsis cihanbeyliensis]
MTVARIIAELARAWNAGDGAAWAANFAEDADFVDVVGRVQHGREVIGREHQKIFDTIYRGSRLEIHELNSRGLAGDVLLVHTVSALEVPSGPRAGNWRAIQTKIIRDGEILAFHNTGRDSLAGFTNQDEDLAQLDPLDWQGS